MCFVFIWEQTVTCATYSINWLVFIAEVKSVYSAVRTGSLIWDKNMNDDIRKYFYAPALCLIGKNKTATTVTVWYTYTYNQLHTSSVQGFHFYQNLLYLACNCSMSVHANSTAIDTGRQYIIKTVFPLGPKAGCYSDSNRLLQWQ